MTIEILPPQLANQIAAGEVVERPASVVKELVENALDAGANKVEIEIERGGHKRILIRDDGKGVDKSQLTLALSRHATSKIKNIDDLEAIVSLGFRGEALASISSVSRLTMTSKPAEQTEAWSAMAEGLDMAVQIKPAAHPNGTSVDVVDLFFNTPARRKFLRAEKTEFTHIESLIKRIAMSRPDVTFVLKHNGKAVRRYRKQNPEVSLLEQFGGRIDAVIGNGFIEQSNDGELTYDQIQIKVWVKQPEACASVNPAQYSFVNGRMMRDKLIQHAIRQAFAETLHREQQPEYVVFIDLPATDVDVNVHPAKHEVRFHHARLLHDLVVRAIQDALSGFQQKQAQLQDDTAGQEAPVWLAEPNQAYRQAMVDTQVTKSPLQTAPNTSQQSYSALKPRPSGNHFNKEQVSRHQQRIFQDFVEAKVDPTVKPVTPSAPVVETGERLHPESQRIDILFIERDRYVYMTWSNGIYLLDWRSVEPDVESVSPVNEQQLLPTPLLVPVRLKLSDDEVQWWHQYLPMVESNGFECKLHGQFVIIKQVPNLLRQSSNQTLPALFDRLMAFSTLDETQLKQLLLAAPTKPLTKEGAKQTLIEWQQAGNLERRLEQQALALNAEQLLAAGKPKSTNYDSKK